MLMWIVIVAGLAAMFWLLPWFAQRMQSMAGDSAGGSGAFQALQEVFHPAAHSAEVIRRQTDEARSQAAAPDDPPDGQR
ncbi:hypothetical protein MU582_19620 [Nocardioidaceae bacterium SCSIO 66511]|nr:hypothetical protein MU582_19620 [Nocardioidaceae bacterium SCSIO 66511]